MNGVELLIEVKEINPSVKTLLISALDLKDNIIRESVCVDKILQKPIAMKALIEVQAQIKLN